jgi:hypothetical protein
MIWSSKTRLGNIATIKQEEFIALETCRLQAVIVMNFISGCESFDAGLTRKA